MSNNTFYALQGLGDQALQQQIDLWKESLDSAIRYIAYFPKADLCVEFALEKIRYVQRGIDNAEHIIRERAYAQKQAS
jgi:hypothetical protein